MDRKRSASILLACVNYAVANLEHITTHPFKAGFPKDINLDEFAELGAKFEAELLEIAKRLS